METKIIQRSLIKLLRPIAKLLLRSGVSYQSASECMKQAFVEAAERDFGLDGKAVTTSRVATLTGLNRKEVKRLRELSADDSVSNHMPVNRAQRVINAWLNDSDYISANGKPITIPMDGPAPSFSHLVKLSSGDIPVKSIFDELIRLNCIVIDDDGKVRLYKSGLIAMPGSPQQWQVAATSGADLFSTLEHNINAEKDQVIFQRFVHYSYLPSELLEEFEALSADKNQALLVELNQWLKQHAVSAKQSEKIDTVPCGVGIYQIRSEHKD